MSWIALSLKLSIAGSALAGLSLLACGGDDSGSKDKTTDNGAATASDAGTSTKDSGAASNDAGLTITHAEPGDDCDPKAKLTYALCSGCGATYCTVSCGSNGTYGPCVNPVAAFADSGVLGGPKNDAGTHTIKDGSVAIPVPGSDAGAGSDAGTVSDAGMEIPTTCPDKFTCTNLGGLLPVSYCSDNLITPPACTTLADCTNLGFKFATCAMSPIPLGGLACLQYCK